MIRRTITIAAFAAVAAGCGGWGYGATPTREHPGNHERDAVHEPAPCFVVSVNDAHGFLATAHNNIQLGLYCRVANPPAPKAP